jgi:hypothetical protein
MPYCLPKNYLEKVKQAIREGKFDMEKFNVDSQTRRSMLAEIVGNENAEQVNTIYEKNLLLKNQEAAMYRTVSEITGVTAQKKAELAEKIKQTYADKNRRLYEPSELENHLNELTSDIYSKKYKTEISLEQAQMITELAQDMKVAKEAIEASGKKGFGAAKVALDNYVNGLRMEAVKTGFTNPLKEQGISAKVGAVYDNARVSVNFIAENSRAIVASIDNSFWGRQGLRALLDPRTSKVWLKDFGKSWVDIGKTIRGGIGKGTTKSDVLLGRDAIRAGDAIVDGVKAEIYERPNFLNGRYEGKAGEGTPGTKLDIGTGEEAYPTSKPSKIPILGRFFKGSEVAYEAGAMRLRADIADKVYAMAEKSGADMTDNKVVGDLNEVINGMTGRGSFGKRAGGFERATNKAFFSIKFFKSNLDYLTLPFREPGRVSGPARKLAATNLLYTAATTAVIMGIAKALNPDDNKDIFNITSSNFGKIRKGNMSFDLTHGAGGIVVAMSKILTQKSTNATTGITTKLGEGYGSQRGMDVVWNFTENKFAPMFSVLKEIIDQQTFNRKKPTVLGEAGKLTTPISIQNISQFQSEPVAMRILGYIAEGIGLNTNVIAPGADWGENTSKELQQFKAKVGDATFKVANDEYNKRYSTWLAGAKKSEQFQALSGTDQQKAVAGRKAQIKNAIFKEYKFDYKPEQGKGVGYFGDLTDAELAAEINKRKYGYNKEGQYTGAKVTVSIDKETGDIDVRVPGQVSQEDIEKIKADFAREKQVGKVRVSQVHKGEEDKVKALEVELENRRK